MTGAENRSKRHNRDDHEALKDIHRYSRAALKACALAAFLQEPARYESLPGFFERKRNLLREVLASTPLTVLPCSGSYFLLAQYDAVSAEPAAAFAERLVREAGVATIPLSAFYTTGRDDRVLRSYPELTDDAFVAEHVDEWLAP